MNLFVESCGIGVQDKKNDQGAMGLIWDISYQLFETIHFMGVLTLNAHLCIQQIHHNRLSVCSYSDCGLQ